MGGFAMVLPLLLFLQTAFAREVCYDGLGCFDDSASCHSTRFPPESPAVVNTQFFLYTRSNQAHHDDHELLDRTDDGKLRASLFDGLLQTKFIIHGFTDTIFSDYFQAIKDSLLNKDNMNVIMVDWNNGAVGGYNLCRQNTRVVGREIAMMARALNRVHGADFGDMHLIGHSLGAHTAGYAGAFQSGLGRITGLDPAGPSFRGVDPECRLDPSDALFVDNIHTDTHEILGMGILEPVGHVDFYPNGGNDMPGCPLLREVACDHFRSVYYFEESIRSTECAFTAYPCSAWNQYQAGLCTRCGLAGCPEMGYNADQSTATGSFYLETNEKDSYCKQ